ncbi:unnamed protein product [Caenorhabditis brenneri]
MEIQKLPTICNDLELRELQAKRGDVNATYKYDRERMMAMKKEMSPESASKDSQTEDSVKKTDEMAVKSEEKENVEEEKPAVQKPFMERKKIKKLITKPNSNSCQRRRKIKKEEEQVHVKRAKADVLKQSLLVTSRTHSPTSDTTLCNYLQDLVFFLKKLNTAERKSQRVYRSNGGCCEQKKISYFDIMCADKKKMLSFLRIVPET